VRQEVRLVTDYHAAAVARAATFEQRGADRNFLASWIPEAQLVAAFEAAMRRHGDPERWWDIDSLA
jgi:hypothetical protein